jgi:hypothetical protein
MRVATGECSAWLHGSVEENEGISLDRHIGLVGMTGTEHGRDTVSTRCSVEARVTSADWAHHFPFLIQMDCRISAVNSLILIYITLFRDRARSSSLGR